MSTKRGVHNCNRAVPSMSIKRGVHNCNRPAPAPASVREPLPMDLLLEIVRRCDVTTIVRCARASKFLRGGILDPAFPRRLALQASAGGGGFDPALLFGVSYLTYGARLLRFHHFIDTPSSIQLHADVARRKDCSLQYSFEPVDSRGPLLLLRRFGVSPVPPNVELRVCDTTTGHVTPLPNAAMFFKHAFLSVSDPDDTGGSYELIVTDKGFRFKTLSKKHGHWEWDAVRQASAIGWCPGRLDASSRVIGRTVYWLCELNSRGSGWGGILALDVDAAEGRTMELPPGFGSRMMSCKREKHLLLASVRGRLSLLVAESDGISMWTLTPAAATWSRQLVIGAEEIVRPVGLVSSPLSYVLEGFGERSGAVIVRVDRRDLLRIDLGTKVVTRLHNPGDAPVACLFLHETDLASLLKKSF